MKCQHCNKNEATAYFKQNINGNVTEMHLCEDCAKELGLMNDSAPKISLRTHSSAICSAQAYRQ